MNKYTFTVTKTFSCYGYQAERHYEVKCKYFTAKLKYLGNHGFDAPQIIRTDTSSTYYDAMNSFMKSFYKGSISDWFSNYKDNETRTFELERYF